MKANPEAKRFASRVNYAKYDSRTYNRNIRGIIPGYSSLHTRFIQELARLKARSEAASATEPAPGAGASSKAKPACHIKALELGPGTGNSTAVFLKSLPNSSVTGVELLPEMKKAAEARLGREFPGHASFILSDYSAFLKENSGRLRASFDAVFSFIGVHHLSHSLKQALFKDIYAILKPGGVLLLGDLMDFENARKNKEANEKARAHLLAHASTPKIAVEWLDHWNNLNICAPVEVHLRWLAEAGFQNIRHAFEFLTTNLLVAEKPGGSQ